MRRLQLFALLAVLAAATVLAVPAQAHSHRAHVFGPHARPYGVSYTHWAESWFRWLIGTPIPHNPIANPSDCTLSPKGKVVFLRPSFGGRESVDCVVPEHKAFLISPAGGFCDTWPPADPVHRLRACARQSALASSDRRVVIDGRRVRHLYRYFLATPVFRVRLPKHNVVGAPRGTYKAAIAGWFLVVRPFDEGRHTITLADRLTDGTLAQITFHLTITEAHR